MDFDDFNQILITVFIFLIAIASICISISVDEIRLAINETNENCVVVNEEIYCKK